MKKIRLYTIKNKWLFLPLLGILLFILLYYLATVYYPGGSNENRASKGFDWMHNYWCDLTGKFAKNGQSNPARKISLAAMIILCSALSVFWVYLPRLFHENKFNQIIIRYAGIGSMGVLVFLFTNFHDTVIGFGSLLSIIPITGTFRVLFTNNFMKLFALGIFSMILVLLNYLIYMTDYFILFLPLIQKITFVFFLSWIFCINVYCLLLLKSAKNPSQFREASN